ncbi:MAG: hypothetical protein E7271_02100 [Lachnospiraceae bacterium]|jgi:hypothetical protein|nr:hypothetical protein [Lachnospiraceae bacterium]
MTELLRMRPMDKNVKNASPVFIVTRDGADYNEDGIQYVRNEIKSQFQETNNLLVYTGPGINMTNVLKTQLEKNKSSYLVLSMKTGIIFIPRQCNEDIIKNLTSVPKEDPNATSWEILMDSCHQEIY